MKSVFLLNSYERKNKLKILMKEIPIVLSDIIINYKYQIEHSYKMKEINKEFLQKIYYCCYCYDKKFENITGISYNCNSCKLPICKDCKDYDHCDDKLCNDCILIFKVLSKVESLIGKNLNFNEMEEIGDIIDGITSNEDIEELISVLGVLEEYYIMMPDNEPDYFTYENIKIELEIIINSILSFDEEEI